MIVGYGPQENSLKEKKEKFWRFLEEEANEAELLGHGLVIQMDGNLHGGSELIKNDPYPQNKNGKLFMEFLERNSFLSVANNLDLCKGTITRIRKVQNKTEKAILDFFIMNEKMRLFLSKMSIDEEREFCLSNFSQLKQNKRVIETDHNMMIADFDISVPKRKPERIEIFNLRNKKCQEKFTQEMDENSELDECFESKLPFEIQSKNWLKMFNSTLFKCFRKVRVVNNKKKRSRNEKLLEERVELKKEIKLPSISVEMKIMIEDRISKIEEEISKEISEKYVDEIVETLKNLGGDDQNLNGSGRKKLWEMLKSKYPKFSLQSLWERRIALETL